MEMYISMSLYSQNECPYIHKTLLSQAPIFQGHYIPRAVCYQFPLLPGHCFHTIVTFPYVLGLIFPGLMLHRHISRALCPQGPKSQGCRVSRFPKKPYSPTFQAYNFSMVICSTGPTFPTHSFPRALCSQCPTFP